VVFEGPSSLRGAEAFGAETFELLVGLVFGAAAFDSLVRVLAV
jgi:hypothetical protein